MAYTTGGGNKTMEEEAAAWVRIPLVRLQIGWVAYHINKMLDTSGRGCYTVGIVESKA